MAGEWRLLGWMEKEKYEYDLYSENQFDCGELNLEKYKVLILSTHPEYWTINMYEKLKDWVQNKGGKLLYLGGNGINCSVELHDNAMTVHNMDLSEWLPHRAYSGEGALIPSRFGLRHEVESSLLGVVMSFAGMGTGAPYEAIDVDHPIFKNTNIKMEINSGLTHQLLDVPAVPRVTKQINVIQARQQTPDCMHED